MLISCWSAKGGVGTSVTAAAMAIHAARSTGALLVDLAGDQPAVLGVGASDGPGVLDWLDAGAGVPDDGLRRIEVEVGPDLALLPRGRAPGPTTERLGALIAYLEADPRTVVVDCGRLDHTPDGDGELRLTFARSATHVLLVTRACYLALRLVARAPLRPTGVVVLREPGRALDTAAVCDVVGVDVWCELPVDAAVSRAVDAGLLASRLPRSMHEGLDRRG